jgi:hypothetical protein
MPAVAQDARRWTPGRLLAAAAIAAAIAGCGSEAPAGDPPRASAPPAAAPPAAGGTGGSEAGDDPRRAEVILPGDRRVIAEIADTPARIARGYMFRREVREDEGMVFVFPEPGFHPFWMKNTLVPLDIIWMDDAFTVFHIEHMTPPCKADPCPGYGPVRKARYVLELRGGTARRAGLKPGDRLRIAFPQPGP